MDAFIGQRFEDFETIAGVNVIKLYGDSLLSARLDAQSVGEILVRLVVLVIVQLILPAVDDGLGLLRRFAVQGKTIALIGGIGRDELAKLLNGADILGARISDTMSISSAIVSRSSIMLSYFSLGMVTKSSSYSSSSSISKAEGEPDTR